MGSRSHFPPAQIACGKCVFARAQLHLPRKACECETGSGAQMMPCAAGLEAEIGGPEAQALRGPCIDSFAQRGTSAERNQPIDEITPPDALIGKEILLQ